MAYIDSHGVRQEGRPRRLTEAESKEKAKTIFKGVPSPKGKALKMSKEEYNAFMSKDYGSSSNRRFQHNSGYIK